MLLAMGLLAAGCAGGGNNDPDRANAPTIGQENDEPPAEQLASEQTLNLFSFFKPASFDPARQGPGTSGGNAFGRQYAEALLKPEPLNGELYEASWEVTGATAEGFEVSGDGLTYTFTLRPDAKYNDGVPVRAQDFVYAWRRLVDPRVAAPLGPIFARVVKGGEEAGGLGPDTDPAAIETALDGLGLRAVDDRTFEVTLAQPAPYFEWVATLHQGAPIRQDVVESAGADTWANTPETLVTNGPFKVTEIGQNATVMVRNPHYWGAVRLEKIISSYGFAQAASWTKYLNNELDISNGPLLGARDAALADPSLEDEVLRYPELAIQWLEFNTTKPPFDDPKVRLAFAQAIDREAFSKVAVDDQARPATTLIPKGMPGYSPELGAPQEFNPTEAKATLDSAGVDPAAIGDIKLLTSSVFTPDALFFKDQIEKHLGINVTIEEIGDSAALNSRVKAGEYQFRTTFQGHSANYPDPQDFFDVFLSTSPNNRTGWKNAEYDRLVREADFSRNDDDREKLYDQAHEILVREAPVVFLSQLERIFWVKPWVKGITRTGLDSAAFPGDLYSNKIWIAEH